jgi:hypothetical protein
MGMEMAEQEPPFTLRYIGINPQALDAHELISTLSAIARISENAGQALYGEKTPTSFRIVHVHRGSLNIQGFVELVAGFQPFFAQMAASSFGISDVPGLIKAWFDLLKFLKGDPPRVTQKVENGNAVQIENANGQTQVINGNVYNFFLIANVGRDAAKLETPSKQGAEELQLYRGERKIATYTAQDLSKFRPIKPLEAPLESEIKAIVEVIAPVFQGEGVWRFKFGHMTLTARLLDEEYRAKVQRGDESFRRGDRLDVQLKTVQERVGTKISTKHFIVKVNGRV